MKMGKTYVHRPPSPKHNSRRDRIAINTKIIAGAIVQIVSSICPQMNRLVCLFWIILITVYNTIIMIINIIIKA